MADISSLCLESILTLLQITRWRPRLTEFPNKVYSVDLDISTTFLLLTSLCLEVKERNLLSHVRLFATPYTVVYQALLPSMGFSRQEYWSGLPFPSPGHLANPGVEPGLPHCRQTLYRLSHLPLNVHVSQSSMSLCIIFLKDNSLLYNFSPHPFAIESLDWPLPLLSPHQAFLSQSFSVCVCVCVCMCLF